MRRVAVTVALLVAFPAAAADWGVLENQGASVAYLAQPGAAWLSPFQALVVGVRDDAGVARLGASLFDRGTWQVVSGTPESGAATNPRSPGVVADGAGHAVLLHAGFTGLIWRLYARRFDGAGFSDLAGGIPVDRDAGGNVNGHAGAFVTETKLLVLYVKDNGSRMAVFVRSWSGGGWQDENGGQPLDDPAGTGCDSPAIAPDGQGGALVVFVQYGPAGGRLVAMRYDGAGWHAANGGAPLDRPDLGGVSAPKVSLLGSGRWLVAWVQEVGNSQRLYGIVWTGSSWERVNGGEPLDSHPKGVRDAMVAADGTRGWTVTYSTFDAVDGIEAPTVRAVRVTGLAVAPMNGGETLEAAGAWTIPAIASAATRGATAGSALLVMEQASGGVSRMYARAIREPATATPSPETGAGWSGSIRVTHNVFHPALGEHVRIECSVPAVQRVRVSVYSLSGLPVRVVAEGPVAGRAEWAWDGRDDAEQDVSAGVYLLVAEGGTFRETRKIVVVR